MGPSVDESGISDDVVQVYFWVVFAVLCQTINIFGIITNIINVICFAKQGFDDSVNISLVGLTISDLGSLITMVWTCLCVTPALQVADLPFEPFDISYLVSAIPHLSFTRVSACLTAVISLERCLCITSPFKIKSLITPTRSLVITVCVFVTFLCSGAPVYVVNGLGMKFSILRNRTLVGIISTENREYVDMMSFAVNNFAIPFIAFVVIVICTIIISVKLQSHTRWRERNMKNANGEICSSRNQKTAKMVVMISALFIVCFIPLTIAMLTAGLLPDLQIHGKYMNISIIITGFSYVLESINSSMNIFIYYNMSSVYRDNFSKLFRRNK